MTARSEKGEKIDSKDIKKHRNDVFRLAQLLAEGAPVSIPAPIQDDLKRFIHRVEADEEMDPKSFGVPMNRRDGIALLRAVYRIS